MDLNQLKDVGDRYTAAWCSQDAARVAAFFAENGSCKSTAGSDDLIAASMGQFDEADYARQLMA